METEGRKERRKGGRKEEEEEGEEEETDPSTPPDLSLCYDTAGGPHKRLAPPEL
jgi:hypothetical protein